MSCARVHYRSAGGFAGSSLYTNSSLDGLISKPVFSPPGEGRPNKHESSQTLARHRFALWGGATGSGTLIHTCRSPSSEMIELSESSVMRNANRPSARASFISCSLSDRQESHRSSGCSEDHLATALLPPRLLMSICVTILLLAVCYYRAVIPGSTLRCALSTSEASHYQRIITHEAQCK